LTNDDSMTANVRLTAAASVILTAASILQCLGWGSAPAGKLALLLWLVASSAQTALINQLKPCKTSSRNGSCNAGRGWYRGVSKSCKLGLTPSAAVQLWRLLLICDNSLALKGLCCCCWRNVGLAQGNYLHGVGAAEHGQLPHGPVPVVEVVLQNKEAEGQVSRGKRAAGALKAEGCCADNCGAACCCIRPALGLHCTALGS
jgi:hypothetical protein